MDAKMICRLKSRLNTFLILCHCLPGRISLSNRPIALLRPGKQCFGAIKNGRTPVRSSGTPLDKSGIYFGTVP